MNRYSPLHVHIFSLLDSISCVDKFVERAKEINATSLAITDHGTLAGAIKFHTACKKGGIKPILGLEAYICDKPATQKDDENRSLMHVILLAKNLEGWYDLVKINNISNKGEHFYYNPRAHLDDIKEITKKGNLIGMSACIGGVIATKLFDDYKGAYREKTEQGVALCLKENCIEEGVAEAKKWNDAFDGNFYLEVQNEGMASQTVVRDCLRKISKKTGIKVVATTDSHFPKKEDAIIHEALICSQTRKTIKQRAEMRSNGEDMMFSDNSQYYVKTYDEMIKTGFTKEELENTNFIADQIEEFELRATKPRLPSFPLPKGVTNKEEFFISLCKDGLKRIGKENDQVYKDRANMEFKVLKSVSTGDKIDLLDYFLIVWDIVQQYKKIGTTLPIGRGSSAGSLIAYLLEIVQVDAIKFNLSFERFYNIARCSEGHTSMPDIDIDISSEKRAELLDYIKNKYGEGRVFQISTMGTLASKAALKESMKISGVHFDDANAFTKMFPEKELKNDEDSSICISDALEISPEFKKEAEKYKSEIAIAIGLEGVAKSRGTHAAGVILKDDSTIEDIPLVWDTKLKTMVCALDMDSVDFLGLLKVDILGLRQLGVVDLCIQKINELGLKPNKVKIKDDNYENLKSEEVILDYFKDNGFTNKRVSFWHEFKKGSVNTSVLIKSCDIKKFMSNKVDNEIYIYDKDVENGRLLIVDKNNVFVGGSDDICNLRFDKIVRFGVIQNGKLVKTLKK